MKKIFSLTLILLSFSLQTFAQQKQKTNDNFLAFWKTFKIALTKDSKATILNVINYPIRCDYETVNDEQTFIEEYSAIFSEENKQKLIQATLEKGAHSGAPTYYVKTENSSPMKTSTYFFIKKGKYWKLTGIVGVHKES